MMVLKTLKDRLLAALKEDGAFFDVTTQLLAMRPRSRLKAKLVAKANGIFCGAFLLRPVFSLLDPSIKTNIQRKDGQTVRKGMTIATIAGRADAILGAERVFLNLACHLSGIATLTGQYVKATKGSSAIICDTRKTTPLWRDLERIAVRCGGGTNHRFSLSDAILVKDNHLAALRRQSKQVSDVYSASKLPAALKKRVSFVEVEAETLDDVWQAIKAKADIILLDNMTVEGVQQSMDMIRAARRVFGSQTPLVEVSGGVTLDRVSEISAWGVDRISVGAITHSVPSLDLSLEVE